MKPWHPQLSFKWPCTQGESVDSGRWSANGTSMWLEEWNELKGCFKVTVFSSLKGWFCYRDQKNKKSFVTNSTNFNLKLRFTSPVFQ